MKPLKLHLRTTLLVSAITLGVMIALLLVISARLVDLMREEEMALTDAEATGLAEHFGQLAHLPDSQEAQDATKWLNNARRDEIVVRIWELAGQESILKWTNIALEPAPTVSASTVLNLKANQIQRIQSGRAIETRGSPYKVFVPIVHQQNVLGAVEISDRLDNLPTVLQRLFGTATLLALLAVGLIGLATYTMFRDLIYRPIDQMLRVISKAKLGEFNVQAPERRSDELGRLSQQFNEMLGKIDEMTSEREQQQEILKVKVQEATAQLEQRNDQLAQSNQELWNTSRRLTQLERLAAAGQTAAQLAHEVGTPLNLISCHTQLLLTEADDNPSSVKERAGIVIEQTDRIERIVRRMLDRTRVEKVEHAPLNLNHLVQRIVESTSPMLVKRGVTLDILFDDRLYPIAGDADKLQQVFINLINNALDAMPKGGHLSITTLSEPPLNGHGPRTLVTVADNGSGMTPEVRAHIFDPLYTTKERGKGTGLGLVVVSQVMQEHDALITVESSPGAGSRFQLSFPAIQQAEAPTQAFKAVSE